MIWTETTKTAYDIACWSHRGQSDRGGAPYIIHPCTLAAQMPDEETTAAALLHDALEDSDTTELELVARGIPETVVQAVVLLSRNLWPCFTYMEYIKHLRRNPIAATVKKADLRHNLDLSRLGRVPTEEDMRLHRRYEKALQLLEE